MKHIMLACAILLVAQFTKAQEIETLAGHSGSKAPISAYGTPLGRITAIDGKFAVMTGGYGGVLFNKKLMLGAGGYSLANRIGVEGTTDHKWGMWYTGAVAEYVHHSDKLFHWSAGALIGGGGISDRTGRDKGRDIVHNSGGFFVAEPFVNVELNITSYLRLVAGGSYRQILGTPSGMGISDAKLSAPGFHLGIKAGCF